MVRRGGCPTRSSIRRPRYTATDSLSPNPHNGSGPVPSRRISRQRFEQKRPVLRRPSPPPLLWRLFRVCLRPPLRPPWLSASRLEICLQCDGNLSVVFGAIFAWVFGADIFQPIAEARGDRRCRRAIGDGCGPWCGEDVWIIHGKHQLQVFAAVAEIHGRRVGKGIVFEGPVQSFFCLLVI